MLRAERLRGLGHAARKPDVGLTTLSEIVDTCRYVANAVTIPVIADPDAGFGNAINAMRTVEEVVKAGAAGLHLEDQVAPNDDRRIAGAESSF